MNCTIEQIHKADDELAAAFTRLIPQLNPAHTPPTLDELEQILSGETTELFAARAVPGGKILGVLALVVFHTPTGTHAWIEDVVVDETARGLGLGEALSRAALQRAAERGADTVNLTSRASRTAANHLYQRLGFELRQSNLYRYHLGGSHNP
jgi:ribosomal protein S18 acetylase RimI-like enzyme